MAGAWIQYMERGRVVGHQDQSIECRTILCIDDGKVEVPQTVGEVATQAAQRHQKNQKESRSTGPHILSLREIPSAREESFVPALCVRSTPALKPHQKEWADPHSPAGAFSGFKRTLSDLGAWLVGTSEQGRAALRALLGDRRLRIEPDPDRGFRIDGGSKP